MEEKIAEIIKLAQEIRVEVKDDRIKGCMYDIVEKAQDARYIAKHLS